MKHKSFLISGSLAILVCILTSAGCGGGAVSILTIPTDYKLQTADLGVGLSGFQAQDIHDYERKPGDRLMVIQLKYKSDTPLQCFDERGNKLRFVGSLIEVDTGARSALIARELQVMGDSTLVAYVFAVPMGTKAISVAGHGQHELVNLIQALPPINPEELKINKLVRERN
jgi:hypothetical protein